MDWSLPIEQCTLHMHKYTFILHTVCPYTRSIYTVGENLEPWPSDLLVIAKTATKSPVKVGKIRDPSTTEKLLDFPNCYSYSVCFAYVNTLISLINESSTILWGYCPWEIDLVISIYLGMGWGNTTYTAWYKYQTMGNRAHFEAGFNLCHSEILAELQSSLCSQSIWQYLDQSKVVSSQDTPKRCYCRDNFLTDSKWSPVGPWK